MSILSLNPNAEQIVFEVSSEKNSVQLTNLDKSIAEYCDGLAPDARYMTEFTIKVFAVDYNGENVLDIGFLEGLYFESEALIAEDLSFTSLCDMFTQDVYEMAGAITDKRGSINPFMPAGGKHHLYQETVHRRNVQRFRRRAVHPQQPQSFADAFA